MKCSVLLRLFKISVILIELSDFSLFKNSIPLTFPCCAYIFESSKLSELGFPRDIGNGLL